MQRMKLKLFLKKDLSDGKILADKAEKARQNLSYENNLAKVAEKRGFNY